MSAVAQQHDRLGGVSLQDYVVFNRVTRVACAGCVSDDRVKANSLTTLADGGNVEGLKSDQAILVGGGWADMSAANTELANAGSVVLLANRSWQLMESMEKTREHSVSRKTNAELTLAFEGECQHISTLVVVFRPVLLLVVSALSDPAQHS